MRQLDGSTAKPAQQWNPWKLLNQVEDWIKGGDAARRKNQPRQANSLPATLRLMARVQLLPLSDHLGRTTRLSAAESNHQPAREIKRYPSFRILLIDELGYLPLFCRPTMMEAKELNNMQALAQALWHAGWLAHFERDPAEVERLASDLIELSNRQNFAPFLTEQI